LAGVRQEEEMPTDFWFRFSTYLSLVLSCAALGYAEWQFLPEVAGFAGLIVALLVVSFALDRRFELSLAKANALGLVIGVAAFVWMVVNLKWPRSTLAEIDFPTSMLPLIGPVLMALIPAKLFRPKHVGDWWAMHGVAVAGVALASSMTDDAPFVGVLAAYAVCSAWALVLFFYRRSGGFIAPIPNRPAPPPAQLAPADPDARPPRWVFARTLIWLGGSAAVAVVLFVVLPRSGGYAWAFTKKYYVTGDSNETTLTVAKSGELTESDEPAFKVTVTNAAGNPVGGADADGNFILPLDPDQHWRSREYVAYSFEDGKREATWQQMTVELMPPLVGGPAATAADFGPGGYTLRFELATPKQQPVAVSPVRWVPDRAPAQAASGRTASLRNNATTLFWASRPERYTQATGPADPPDAGTAFEVSDPRPVVVLKRQGPDYFREYARKLLADLIAAGTVPAAARLNDRDQVPDEWHEAVARAFTAHVRDSGEFTYSTTLEPKDRKLDPLVDFVKNTKTGHCEWFAGALVLSLRAVGIPAQLVTGYRGWEADENGDVVVLQRHAHAWAEVLVSSPAPADFPFRVPPAPGQPPRVWRWLTLDPTPGSSGQVAEETNWFKQGAGWITNFLLRFDKEKQQKAVEELTHAAQTWWPWAVGGLAVAVAGRLGWRWWAKRMAGRATFDGPDWYARFQAVLASHGLTRGPGQTPREFAAAATAAFPAAADAVQFVTSKLYRVRYAGMPLKPDELAQVNTALDGLERLWSSGK
jgi:transglutaminase-like putative cysteine protease